MISISDLVKRLIDQHRVLIFSKTYCPYCRKAKDLLRDDLKAGPHIVELDERDDGSAIQEELYRVTNQKTVPSIFIRGKHIGGCDALVALHEKGKLADLLKA